MNIKRILIASVAGFVSVFLFEMLWHGFLMKGMYEATQSVWRPEDEHDMIFMFASQFLFAGAMALAYEKMGQNLKCKVGLMFGFFTGLILAMPQLGTYCYLPIPLSISLLWMLAALLKCIVVSMVIAFIYKKVKA